MDGCPLKYTRFNKWTGDPSYIRIIIQGISEKCTGAFKFGCRIISVYPKVAAIVVSSIEFTKKNILYFNFITNINICKYILKILSIIFNVHNDPSCFEDK